MRRADRRRQKGDRPWRENAAGGKKKSVQREAHTVNHTCAL
jgi:hypothetical protein